MTTDPTPSAPSRISAPAGGDMFPLRLPLHVSFEEHDWKEAYIEDVRGDTVLCCRVSDMGTGEDKPVCDEIVRRVNGYDGLTAKVAALEGELAEEKSATCELLSIVATKCAMDYGDKLRAQAKEYASLLNGCIAAVSMV